MTLLPAPNATAAGSAVANLPAGAQADLARVQGKVDAARAVLLRLLQEVVVAESRLSNSQADKMLEANEGLVLAAMRDRESADAAAQSLSDVTRLANLDPLTGLPNRALLLDRLAQAIATAKRRDSRVALLFLDLDNFKEVNDTLGHAAGDQALQQVALRLGHAVREADTVGRCGGDEFLVVLTEVSQASDAAVIARKLLATLGEPLRVGNLDLGLSASIGISLYPDDGMAAEALIGKADAAMYHAKSQGPGGLALHGERVPARPGLPPLATQHARSQAMAAQARRLTQLQEANEQLVLAALDAQELQAAAERALQRQADFMAAVAQELGNPHAPIRVAATMLGRGAGDAVLMPRVQALVDQQAAHMLRLVQAASARSRAAAMRLATGQQVCDLLVVIDAAVAAARPLMDLRQQRLTVVTPAGPIAVRGDTERLGLVLGNLLDNASKYTLDSGTIRLDAAVQGAHAVLTVTDDGIGMAPAVVPHIFEPFGQDSWAIGINGTSTGIGLPVVRALLTELGGSVQASSAGHGRGSRFVVTLPLAESGLCDSPGLKPESA